MAYRIHLREVWSAILMVSDNGKIIIGFARLGDSSCSPTFAWVSEHLPWQSAGMLSLIDDDNAIDQHIVNALWILVWIVLKRVSMRIKIRRAVSDPRQVKHDDVCPSTGA